MPSLPSPAPAAATPSVGSAPTPQRAAGATRIHCPGPRPLGSFVRHFRGPVAVMPAPDCFGLPHHARATSDRPLVRVAGGRARRVRPPSLSQLGGGAVSSAAARFRPRGPRCRRRTPRSSSSWLLQTSRSPSSASMRRRPRRHRGATRTSSRSAPAPPCSVQAPACLLHDCPRSNGRQTDPGFWTPRPAFRFAWTTGVAAAWTKPRLRPAPPPPCLRDPSPPAASSARDWPRGRPRRDPPHSHRPTRQRRRS